MDVSYESTVVSFRSIINYKQPIFWAAIAHVIFNPLFWNVAGRLENKKQVISKLCGNDKKKGCYLLAATIFTLGLTRDYLVIYALGMQPKITDFLSFLNINTPIELIQTIGNLFLIYGSVLVIMSTYRLGITGTYLGDYFGILMESRVTAFPYNLHKNPMYFGSTLCFLGHALRSLTASGILIAFIVWVGYQIAIKFEEPFTAECYNENSKIEMLKVMEIKNDKPDDTSLTLESENLNL